MRPSPLARAAVASHAVAAVMLVLLAGSARGEEYYFLAMFASQTMPPQADYSHTFATFVKARAEGPCPTAYAVEDCFTISWLPRNLKVRTRALLPECGANFGLHDTIRYAYDNGERVSMWGPYQIDGELYYQAVRQLALLESGQVKYKAVDSGYPTNKVSNCIHAVSSSAEGYRVRVLSPAFGQTASWTVLQAFKPWVIDERRTHEWVYSYLELENYPIIRRDFERNPRTGVFWTMIKTVVGRRD